MFGNESVNYIIIGTTIYNDRNKYLKDSFKNFDTSFRQGMYNIKIMH